VAGIRIAPIWHVTYTPTADGLTLTLAAPIPAYWVGMGVGCHAEALLDFPAAALGGTVTHAAADQMTITDARPL
jgi:hypothetical protein